MDEKTTRKVKFIVNAAYLAIIGLICYLALKYVAGYLMPLILAFCAVSAAHPLSQRLVKGLGLRRELAAVLVMVAAYALLGGAALLIFAGLFAAVRSALPLLPGYYYGSLEPAMESLGKAYANFAASLPEQLRLPPELGSALAPALQSLFTNISRGGLEFISSLTGKVPSFLLTVLFTIMLSFFISLSFEETTGYLKAHTPPKALRVLREARICLFDAVLKYLGAALTLMVITFCELSIGLLLLRRENALVIAAGIALLDALPVFGAGAALAPWAITELIRGNTFFGVGLLLLWGVLAFVRSMLEPKIVGDKLGLNPIISLTAIFFGYKVFGFTGMFFMPILTQIGITLYRKGFRI